ncbi:MAG: biopolymer transporter ExbD [Nannocystaceae bacterium]|nr:biopolymer transporter ExbD [Myxococcales bacterium]
MRSDEPGGGPITGINVTPLVDISLVLLIILMVTAKVVATPAVPLDLPHASHTTEVQVVLSVIVPARGPILVNGAPTVDDAALRRLVTTTLERDPSARAVIHAEGRASHERVLHVLDRLRGAGIDKVAFAADPLPSPEVPP